MLRNLYEFVKDDEFRFTVYSNRVHIINYDKIDSLNSDYILVSYSNKKVSIKGRDLVLNKMLNNELLVVGVVKNIEVIYE